MIVLAQGVTQLQETSFALQRLLPRVLACVAILAIGYLVARLLTRAVARLLAGTGFERMVRSSGIDGVVDGHDITALLSRVVFWGLLLVVLQLAFAVFGPNPVSASLAGVIAFLPRLLVAIVIVALAATIASAARQVVSAQAGELGYAGTLAACAYAVVLGIGVFAALDQLQVAPAIVNGLFYALLAIIVGVTVVAVGGGGIVPMRQRWDQALTRVDTDAARLRDAAPETHDTHDTYDTPANIPFEADAFEPRSSQPVDGEPDRPPIRYRAGRRHGDANDRQTRPFAPAWDTDER